MAAVLVDQVLTVQHRLFRNYDRQRCRHDWMGGAWAILPLAWLIERRCNSFWHVWWAIHLREYSPGLVNSILIWMTPTSSYAIVRPISCYSIFEAVPALAIGLAAAAFLSLLPSRRDGESHAEESRLGNYLRAR